MILRLNMPGAINQLRFPKALDRRLHYLLDKQNLEGKLSRADRAEAEALVEIAENLSFLRLCAEKPTKRRRPSA